MKYISSYKKATENVLRLCYLLLLELSNFSDVVECKTKIETITTLYMSDNFDWATVKQTEKH